MGVAEVVEADAPGYRQAVERWWPPPKANPAVTRAYSGPSAQKILAEALRPQDQAHSEGRLC